jgi:hypothetical protein
MRIEPLPDIRYGVVERLVKTLRYVAQMRRCQYVVQRPEGVRRRQRLNVEYVQGRAGDLPVLQHADQSLLFDDRPMRCVDQPAVDFILSSSAAPFATDIRVDPLWPAYRGGVAFAQ